MKATEANFLEFLKKSPQFVIPLYQRTYGVHGGQWRISVGAPRDDADRAAMEAWIGRLRARSEETVGVEVEPGSRSEHAIDL